MRLNANGHILGGHEKPAALQRQPGWTGGGQRHWLGLIGGPLPLPLQLLVPHAWRRLGPRFDHQRIERVADARFLAAHAKELQFQHAPLDAHADRFGGVLHWGQPHVHQGPVLHGGMEIAVAHWVPRSGSHVILPVGQGHREEGVGILSTEAEEAIL